jgi:hypothetical protein
LNKEDSDREVEGILWEIFRGITKIKIIILLSLQKIILLEEEE